MIIEEGRLEVRWFDTKYLRQLVPLHRACLPRETWTDKDFHDFLSKTNRNNIVKVLVDEKDVVYGSLLYTLSADECRIRRVAVWPDYRRQGLGTFMVHALTGARSPIRNKVFTARVHERNYPAQALFSSMRFAFDPNAPRDKDENGYDYYQFSYMKPEVKTLLACSGK